MPIPSELIPFARDGELVLYVTENREEGVLYDSVRDIASEQLPLQVFFKWGNFEPIEKPD